MPWHRTCVPSPPEQAGMGLRLEYHKGVGGPRRAELTKVFTSFNSTGRRERETMKKAFAVLMSVVFFASLAGLAEAQNCPPEVAKAKQLLTQKSGVAKGQEVQAPRSLAGARVQDPQAQRGQDAQSPRGQDAQAPRSLAGARSVAPQAQRGQDAQAPRGQDAQAPRGQDAQAPRGQDAQAPRGQDA